MVYLRARFYEPELNRFSQKDLLRGEVIQPGSLNRYLYVQNDPVNFIDPSGMRMVDDWPEGNHTRSTPTPTPKSNTPPDPRRDRSAFWERQNDRNELAARGGSPAWQPSPPSYPQNPGQTPDSKRPGVINWLLNLFSCDGGNGEKGGSSGKNDTESDLYFARGGVEYELKGGVKYRIDKADPGTKTQRHIHITYQGKEYIQNEDGSDHDDHRGAKGKLSKKANKIVKEHSGWDYNKNRKEFIDKTEEIITDSGIEYRFADGTTVHVPHNGPGPAIRPNPEKAYDDRNSDETSGDTSSTNNRIYVLPIPGGVPSVPFPSFTFPNPLPIPFIP